MHIIYTLIPLSHTRWVAICLSLCEHSRSWNSLNLPQSRDPDLGWRNPTGSKPCSHPVLGFQDRTDIFLGRQMFQHRKKPLEQLVILWIVPGEGHAWYAIGRLEDETERIVVYDHSSSHIPSQFR
eukprot:TRINITY_DN2744_c0_g1_i1.p1 TRINITY_DN2744_c0_g1~~TRINITY_DN2744_c0_g1_i1.p1  ORF type:complete len:125 (-),score=0.74 TRINITY_DN2744_c0_g1_i1:266-640(-)